MPYMYAYLPCICSLSRIRFTKRHIHNYAHACTRTCRYACTRTAVHACMPAIHTYISHTHCVCTCRCMYIYTGTLIYIYIYIHTHIQTHLYIYIATNTLYTHYTYLSGYARWRGANSCRLRFRIAVGFHILSSCNTYIHVYVCMWNTYASISIYLPIYLYTYLFMYVCMYIYICIYPYVCVCNCTFADCSHTHNMHMCASMSRHVIDFRANALAGLM